MGSPDNNPGEGVEKESSIAFTDLTWQDLLNHKNVVVLLESGHEVGLLATEDDMGRRFIETSLVAGDPDTYFSEKPASGIGFTFGHDVMMRLGAMVEIKHTVDLGN